MSFCLFLRGELQEESLGALENFNWVAIVPILELILPALNEYGNDIVPFSWSQQCGIVGDIEKYSLSSQNALHFDFSLMLMHCWRILYVFSAHQELFDVG